MKPKVYIASPYAIGNASTNVRNSIVAAEFLRDNGFIPFVPLLDHLWNLMFPHPPEYWYEYDNEWLSSCDAVLRILGESRGADGEVDLALRLDIPVLFIHMEDIIQYPHDVAQALRCRLNPAQSNKPEQS